MDNLEEMNRFLEKFNLTRLNQEEIEIMYNPIISTEIEAVTHLYDPPPAAAAKSLQSCPTLCDPRDGSPPGSPVPGILQARTLELVAILCPLNEYKNKKC